MSSSPPQPDCPRIKYVHSFEELVSTKFADGINALCWARALPGDFDEIVAQFDVKEGRLALDEATLNGLILSPAGQAAREVLLADRKALADHGLSPVLDCIHGYPRDEEGGPVITDVYSFHVDSAPVEADTYLCSYNHTASEGLLNEEAVRKVDVPEIRAELLELYGGEDDEEFEEFLSDNCFNLHYAPLPEAQPYFFGIGNLWRIAIAHPESLVPPCIHRAPVIEPGQPARLLLIS
jgi:hypothetical protein